MRRTRAHLKCACAPLSAVMNWSKLTFAWNLIVHQCQLSFKFCSFLMCLTSTKKRNATAAAANRTMHVLAVHSHQSHDINIDRIININNNWLYTGIISTVVIYDKSCNHMRSLIISISFTQDTSWVSDWMKRNNEQKRNKQTNFIAVLTRFVWLTRCRNERRTKRTRNRHEMLSEMNVIKKTKKKIKKTQWTTAKSTDGSRYRSVWIAAKLQR